MLLLPVSFHLFTYNSQIIYKCPEGIILSHLIVTCYNTVFVSLDLIEGGPALHDQWLVSGHNEGFVYSLFNILTINTVG